MSYDPTWNQQDAAGMLVAAEHVLRESDLVEGMAAINRRRRLTYRDDASLSVPSRAGVGPIETLRARCEALLDPPPGGLGGYPPSPESMCWLWPEADADENAVLVAAAPGTGEVNLFAKLNGMSAWTDANLVAREDFARAVHVNELREAMAAMRRGRWTFPVYLPGGIFSLAPDTPWYGGTLYNNGTDELRCVGTVRLADPEDASLCLSEVVVRASSRLELTADDDCTIAAYHCLRQIDLNADAPSWNEYSTATSSAWASPGGTGAGDSTFIDSVALTAGTPGSITGAALASALQNMIDTGPTNLLLRRSDTSAQDAEIAARLIVEFDLLSPPN